MEQLVSTNVDDLWTIMSTFVDVSSARLQVFFNFVARYLAIFTNSDLFWCWHKHCK